VLLLPPLNAGKSTLLAGIACPRDMAPRRWRVFKRPGNTGRSGADGVLASGQQTAEVRVGVLRADPRFGVPYLEGISPVVSIAMIRSRDQYHRAIRLATAAADLYTYTLEHNVSPSVLTQASSPPI